MARKREIFAEQARRRKDMFQVRKLEKRDLRLDLRISPTELKLLNYLADSSSKSRIDVIVEALSDYNRKRFIKPFTNPDGSFP